MRQERIARKDPQQPATLFLEKIEVQNDIDQNSCKIWKEQAQQLQISVMSERWGVRANKLGGTTWLLSCLF